MAIAALALPSLAADLRVGIIGTDSSHAARIAGAFNDPASKERAPGARIVCAFKGGSPDVERSAARVEQFAAELRDRHGVALVATIAEVVARSDAIMILSVDGRAHLPQAREVFGKGKPVFIDKPLGGDLASSAAIVRLARETKTPLLSCSNYRFSAGLAKMKKASPEGFRGATAYGPATIEPTMPDLFFYGVHVAEALYTLLGPGCATVTSVHTADSDVVTGTWPGGRTGVLYGVRGNRVANGAVAFGAKGTLMETLENSFPEMMRQIVRFFQGGEPPVRIEETLEIMAFMQAAEESKRRGGVPVALAALMAEAGGKP
ncbi:MAG: Gfo/Idh/MocA family oxidoreductase [Opitutaceae bacterium]|nr:Gfo/Idh/MocA family oxidoreductase [Opitutaceae bacterium]